ncbi:MAG: hypothetical protein HYR75_06680, partial [Gemmatimonadetes bacterium]|nr:hypothetical protein [Gemmatimonadota bacterium]
MNRNTPWGGVPSSSDSDQLPLGAFEGAPLLPVAEAPREPVESDAPAAYRELPVCGEWTYDTGDDAESRGGATVIESLPAIAMRGMAAGRA